MKLKRNTLIILSSVVGLALVLVACGKGTTSTSGPTGTTSGQTLMQERCTACHSTDRITSAHKTSDQWKTTVGRMVGKGAQLNTQEQQTLIDYLAQTYP
jgi:hypothetical protein